MKLGNTIITIQAKEVPYSWSKETENEMLKWAEERESKPVIPIQFTAQCDEFGLLTIDFNNDLFLPYYMYKAPPQENNNKTSENSNKNDQAEEGKRDLQFISLDILSSSVSISDRALEFIRLQFLTALPGILANAIN